MAGAPDTTSPNFIGEHPTKRPKRSPAKAVKRYRQYYRDILIEKEPIIIR
jgi:hypothetical protein